MVMVEIIPPNITAIALKILEDIEEATGKNFTKKQYLDLECMVSDRIRKELDEWLRYDTDLQEVQK